jgi:putative ABC transport system substrate-binding protein
MLPLGSPASASDQALVDAFRQGLRTAGLIENRDVVLDVAWIVREPDTYHVVDSLLARGVRILVPCGSPASAAARRQTKTIPIVFISVGNPVGIGLVRTLAHPGGNVTGFSHMLAELSGKYVELAREIGRPRAPVDDVWHTLWPDGQYRFQATAAVKGDGGSFVIIQPSPFTFRQRPRLIEAATQHGLGTIYPFPAAANDGATVAFGPAYEHMYRRVGADPGRRQARRSPGAAADQVRPDRQSRGRPHPRPHHPAIARAARGPGPRVTPGVARGAARGNGYDGDTARAPSPSARNRAIC